jgi:sarcosine oxidase subunit beta
MARTADVAVIGDGVVGASVAFHLAAAGASVLVLSRGDGFALSATRGSAGQVRMHHGDAHDARLAALSMDTFEHWADVVGGDCGFRRTGFAFLVDGEHAGRAGGNVAALRAMGVDTTTLTPGELAARQPALDLSDVAAVAYEPRSGYADPARTTGALLERARAMGADVLTGRGGAALRRDGARIVGATVDGHVVSAGNVVLAAGAGSAGICEAARVRLDVREDAEAGAGGHGRTPPSAPGLTSARYGWAVADSSSIPGAEPPCMVIDDLAGTYFRPDGDGRVLFRVPLSGAHGGGTGSGADDEGDPVTPARIAEGRKLAVRLRGIAEARILGTAWATEACTADGRALIGPVTHHPGLYLATAFNGGGFKSAPAVGEAVAAELLSGDERSELRPYRPSRFSTGNPSPLIQRYRHM